MDSYLLLVLSLTLIVALDFLLVCTYLVLVYFETETNNFETGTMQFRCEDLQRSFSPILMILCLFQTGFLIIGFSIISDDINESYQSITDPESRGALSQQWKFSCVAIGSITFVGLGILCFAIRLIGTTFNPLTRLPLTQIKYFWLSHAFLNISAVFAIIISCQELPYKENASKAVMVSLILSAFAIITFELGFGIWIYAALHWLRTDVPVRTFPTEHLDQAEQTVDDYATLYPAIKTTVLRIKMDNSHVEDFEEATTVSHGSFNRDICSNGWKNRGWHNRYEEVQDSGTICIRNRVKELSVLEDIVHAADIMSVTALGTGYICPIHGL
ncbi:hypothetical protein MMC17_007640 [Xylographa soralifera]|nr:hypothetical protein [Xylographa soralifera]